MEPIVGANRTESCWDGDVRTNHTLNGTSKLVARCVASSPDVRGRFQIMSSVEWNLPYGARTLPGRSYWLEPARQEARATRGRPQ